MVLISPTNSVIFGFKIDFSLFRGRNRRGRPPEIFPKFNLNFDIDIVIFENSILMLILAISIYCYNILLNTTLIYIPGCVPIECYSHINCLILRLLSETGFGLLATSKNMNISRWSKIVTSHCNSGISLFTSFWIGQPMLIQIPSFIIGSNEEKIDICRFMMVNVLLKVYHLNDFEYRSISIFNRNR